MTGEAFRPNDSLSGGEIIGRPNAVAILDAGAQYGMDIEQQLKKQGFYAERLSFDTPLEELHGYGAIILSGGPQSVYAPESPKCDPRIIESGEDKPPVLGICYGAQLINFLRGGTVEKLPKREDGFMAINVSTESPIFSELEENQTVLMSHGDTVVELAEGFEVIARSGDLIAGIANEPEQLYGVQFHPEVSGKQGPLILANFLKKVAGIEADYTYTVEEFIEESIAEVKQTIGNRQALAFISGGVDSSAMGALLERALPKEQLHLVYVNNGFMRKNETETVVANLAEGNVHVRVFDGTSMFLSGTTLIDGVETPPLYEVIEPQVKRLIMGDTFIDVEDRMIELLGLNEDEVVLVMGSLWTDLIESGSLEVSDNAAEIKRHHNDTDKVRALREKGQVLEPWRNLQKSEVREVAKALGLPDSIVRRQPFPGPGLAIRIICADKPRITDDFLDTVDQLKRFETENIKTALMPVQTVGVQGDERTYGHLATLSGERDWTKLKQLANEIPTTVHGVNRVVYIFGDPVSGAIDEITSTRLTPDVIEELREVDHTVNQILTKYGLDKSISQVPIISLPVHFGEPGKRSIGIRTFLTTDFKAGDIAIPGLDFPEKILDEIVEEVLKFPNVARVLYDLTSKPPGTTECE